MVKLNLDLSKVKMTHEKTEVELTKELADMVYEIEDAQMLVSSFKNNSEDIMNELTRRGIFPINLLKRR